MTPMCEHPLHTVWDHPKCTKEVYVTRGEHAVMTCNIANPFHNVTVCRSDPSGQHCQPIFQQVTPGCTSQDGWHLWVQGHTAHLVTKEARDTQAGHYNWIIVGLQINHEDTTLFLSGEDQGHLDSPLKCPEPEHGPRRDSATPIPAVPAVPSPPPGRPWTLSAQAPSTSSDPQSLLALSHPSLLMTQLLRFTEKMQMVSRDHTPASFRLPLTPAPSVSSC